MLGLAGLAFAACSSDDEVSNFDNGEKQSVVIKIGNEATSRALEQTPQSEGQIKVGDVTVFYAQDGAVYLSKTIKKEKTEEYNKLFNEGYVEHNLPASINQVYVAANITDIEGLKSLEAIQNKVLAVSGQQDFNNIALFGTDTELTDDKVNTDDKGHTITKKAELTINPLVSRIEINKVQCMDLGNIYNEITLKSIGLLNVFENVNIAGTGSNDLTLANVLEPGSAKKENKYIFGEPNHWAWDAISNVKFTQADNVYPTDGKVVAYHFAANDIKNDIEVRVYLDATKDGVINPVNHIVIAKFPKTTFAPGKIYQVGLVFNEANIGPWDPSQTQCIQVNVTVQKWEVETLTPQYQ